MRLTDIAWRSLSARPLRAILTAAGVALGVAIVAGTLIANQAATETVERAAGDLLGRADLRVRAFAEDGFTPRSVATLRGLPGVNAAAAVSERRLQVTTAPGPDERVFDGMLVIGVDPDAEPAIRDYRLTDGRFLDAASPTDALVTGRWAQEHGLGVGDELRLSGRRPGVPPLQIVGLIEDTGFGALARGSVLVMQRAVLAEAFEMPIGVRYVDLDVAEGQLGEVQQGIDAIGEPYVIETVADAEERLARAQASFAAIAFLFGVVALVVGAFLVANTLAIGVAERTREIGLLRAAGTTARQVLGIVVRQGLALGIAGSLLGVIAGIGLAAVIIWFLGATRMVLIEGLPIGPGSMAVAFALGVAVTVAGSLGPALTASAISPLDALRPSRQPGRSLWSRLRWLLAIEAVVILAALVVYPLDRGNASVIQLLVAVGLLVLGAVAAAFLLQPLGRLVGRPFEIFFGAEGLLGRANLGRDRARTGMTVGALMIALAAVVALGAVAESARATADRWVGSILPGGHAIRLGVPVDVEQVRPTFEATPGTRLVSPIVELPAALLGDAGAQEVSLAGIDPRVYADTGSLIMAEGTRRQALDALAQGGAVLIPEVMARREGLAPGDQVRLGVPGSEGVQFRVAGVVAYTLPGRAPDGALLISRADAEEHFGVTDASLWAMIPLSDEPEAAYRASVEATARSLAGEALTARDLAGELARSLDRLIGLFDALALIAVVVAGLGLLNTLSAGVNERLREIAILRAHGMTAGQVQAMVVSEAAIMGVVGGIAAIGTGLLVAWAMVAVGTPGDFGAGLTVPWPLLVAVVLLGTGVAALAAIYPARLAGRQPIVSHVRHFE